jgi:hypothetical protein
VIARARERERESSRPAGSADPFTNIDEDVPGIGLALRSSSVSNCTFVLVKQVN